MPRTHAPQPETTTLRSPCTATKSNPHLPQFKKVCMEQWRPSTTKKSVKKEELRTYLDWPQENMKRIERKPSLLSPSSSNLRLSNVRRGFKCPKVIYFWVCWPRLTSKWNWLQEKWIKPVLRFFSPPPMESPQNHQEAFQWSVWVPRVATSPLVTLTHQAPLWDLPFLLVSIVLQHPQEVSTAIFLLDIADEQCATLRMKRGPVLKFSIEVHRLIKFPLYNLLVSSIKPGEWLVVLRQIGDV